MHGHARFRLVGDDASDVPRERRSDDVPQPLPFPTCVRKFPRRGGAGRSDALKDHDVLKGQDALEALDRAALSFEKFLRIIEEERRRAELEGGDDHPRAA